MSEAKRYTVSILDESYTLLSDESGECISKAASMIDGLSREILDKTSIDDPKRAAVLAAFKIANRVVKLETDKAKEEERCQEIVSMIEKQIGNKVID